MGPLLFVLYRGNCAAKPRAYSRETLLCAIYSALWVTLCATMRDRPMPEHSRHYRGPPGCPVIGRNTLIPYQGDSDRLSRTFARNRYLCPYLPEKAVRASTMRQVRIGSNYCISIQSKRWLHQKLSLPRKMLYRPLDFLKFMLYRTTDFLKIMLYRACDFLKNLRYYWQK